MQLRGQNATGRVKTRGRPHSQRGLASTNAVLVFSPAPSPCSLFAQVQPRRSVKPKRRIPVAVANLPHSRMQLRSRAICGII